MSVKTCSVKSKSFQVHFVGKNGGSKLSLLNMVKDLHSHWDLRKKRLNGCW